MPAYADEPSGSIGFGLQPVHLGQTAIRPDHPVKSPSPPNSLPAESGKISATRAVSHHGSPVPGIPSRHLGVFTLPSVLSVAYAGFTALLRSWSLSVLYDAVDDASCVMDHLHSVTGPLPVTDEHGITVENAYRAVIGGTTSVDTTHQVNAFWVHGTVSQAVIALQHHRRSSGGSVS